MDWPLDNITWTIIHFCVILGIADESIQFAS